MFPNGSGGLSLSKILSGVSKSLNIIKEVMPIYENVKPIAVKTKNIITKLKKFPNKKVDVNTSTSLKKDVSNNPSFFL